MDRPKHSRRLQSGWNSQVQILFFMLLLSMFPHGHSCDFTTPCQPSNKQCVSGKCVTQAYEKPSHTTASLAAVVTVCTILMLCFWGLLCFACFKQCKECNSGLQSCASTTTINSLAIDISSIDIPDDFFRNARIPSAEEYTGPPPYLQLFNPKVRPAEESRTEETNAEAKLYVLKEELPPQYKVLFSDFPPRYNEVVQYEQTTV